MKKSICFICFSALITISCFLISCSSDNGENPSPDTLSGNDWKEATSSAQFSVRQYFTVLVFDEKLWVIGGSDAMTIYSDVWYSGDGVTWTEATASAEFGKRYGHASVVFDDKMWVIGGVDGDNESRNDVWYSTDGVTWREATASAGFTPRYAHSSAAGYGQMWVMGGRSGDDAMNDVWYSVDGVNWFCATDDAEFSPRQDHASTYFNDKLWVIGGIDTPIEENLFLDDVWYSEDGEKWTKATEGAFTGRENMPLITADERMWMLGGFTNPHSFSNQVWKTSDGAEWDLVETKSDFTPRAAGGGAYFNGKLWVIGGKTTVSGCSNDVWYSK